MPEFLSQRHKLVGLALAIVMELALLIHQFAEMHQRSQHARAVDEPEMDTAAQ